MTVSDAQLYQLVADIGYVPEAELKKAQQTATGQGLPLAEVLLRGDLISDDNLGRLVADALHLPFMSLAQMTVPDNVLRIAPAALAAQFRLVTFGLERDTLKIATGDPAPTDLFLMLAKKCGAKKVRLYYATDRDLQEALQLYRKGLQATFADLLTPNKQRELPVTKVVDMVIEYAYYNKASDIHIEPNKAESLVRFRIDGVLHDVVKLPRQIHEQVIARIKVLARLRTDEHLSTQDGRLHADLSGNEALDVRVSIVPVVTGEKAVLRLLTSHFQQFGLTDLGMNEGDLLKVKAAFTKPYGMILSTGPTGSGKTTSMYAILKILNSREKNIATIEDPVEYNIAGLNQMQANPKTNLTFANGLRSILRQDPDIIYVGEIRDEDTADIAINSAMTGHLVLSTLHTNDAATALPRLIDMKIEPFLVASTVNVIIAQRLIRKICEKCKVSYEMTRGAKGWTGDEPTAVQLGTLDDAAIAKYLGDKTVRLYRGKGCAVCHQTGYTGRIGIFEVLEVSPAIQKLITQKADSDTIMNQAQTDGMTTMLDDGLTKVQQGMTTIGEILRVTKV